ncbi:MAG: hypothetical protein ACLUN5_08070 [Oscillospiraceae bacterium]
MRPRGKRPPQRKKRAPDEQKGKRAPRASNPPNDTIGALCAVIAVVLAVIGIRAGSRLVDIKQTLDRGDGVFYPNRSTATISRFQGKTLDEAAALVTQQVQSF